MTFIGNRKFKASFDNRCFFPEQNDQVIFLSHVTLAPDKCSTLALYFPSLTMNHSLLALVMIVSH